ncbi:unnamed protein product, partial [Scytosiphon promiscuus]
MESRPRAVGERPLWGLPSRSGCTMFRSSFCCLSASGRIEEGVGSTHAALAYRLRRLSACQSIIQVAAVLGSTLLIESPSAVDSRRDVKGVCTGHRPFKVDRPPAIAVGKIDRCSSSNIFLSEYSGARTVTPPPPRNRQP